VGSVQFASLLLVADCHRSVPQLIVMSVINSPFLAFFPRMNMYTGALVVQMLTTLGTSSQYGICESSECLFRARRIPGLTGLVALNY
jgi:hypothetical protein